MSERRRTGWIVSFGGLRVEVSHPFHDQTVKWMGHSVVVEWVVAGSPDAAEESLRGVVGDQPRRGEGCRDCLKDFRQADCRVSGVDAGAGGAALFVIGVKRSE